MWLTMEDLLEKIRLSNILICNNALMLWVVHVKKLDRETVLSISNYVHRAKPDNTDTELLEGIFLLLFSI